MPRAPARAMDGKPHHIAVAVGRIEEVKDGEPDALDQLAGRRKGLR